MSERFAFLFDPTTNLREVCKAWIRLEWHLNDPRKQCPDCITKHVLEAEAFMDEGRALDTRGAFALLFAELERDQAAIEGKIRSGEFELAGQMTREARKGLMAVLELVPKERDAS